MLAKPDDGMLKAFTGLEGGLVASGSTCGVITGGAMGLALRYADDPRLDKKTAESVTLDRIRDFMGWFEDHYGSCLCRYRSRTDFYTAVGQLRYLLPGDRALGCLRHIRGAVRHLHARMAEAPPVVSDDDNNQEETPLHCARQTLAIIRAKTGWGNERLEKSAFIFDGGVGLSGGVCGALAGAIMGLNLMLGLDIRRMSRLRVWQAFTLGHINLLLDKPLTSSKEPFAAGRNVVRRFREMAGGIECVSICGRRFQNCGEFAAHMASSPICSSLSDRAAGIAIREMEKWR